MALHDFKKAFTNLKHLSEEQKQKFFGDALIYIEIPETLDFLFKTLTPFEEKILKMRFGLNGRQKHSAEEIATHFARSPSWVYKRQAKAFRKLRHPKRQELVQAFIKETGIHIDKLESSVIELDPVVESASQLTTALIAYLQSHHEDLEKIRWDVFEHLVAEFFASWGFEDVRLVGRNPMTSADVFAGRTLTPLGTKIRYFIEVKRWKEKVGVQVIDQVYGAMLSERPRLGWHAAMVVSLRGFRDFEKYKPNELALRGIELKNREDLLDWLRGYKPNRNGLWLPEPISTI